MTTETHDRACDMHLSDGLECSSSDTVDVKNPAPLRMPEMYFVYLYQDLFGHRTWCGIFSINRIARVLCSVVSIHEQQTLVRASGCIPRSEHKQT